MAKEIFIHEWKIQDYSGRREQSMKSERTINGEHIYACKHLTSWFRLGKYLIKHDTANYLLGLTDLMSRQEFRDNVKCWEFDEKAGIYHYVCCVDEIVAVVNKKFPAGDYVECLFVMQKALEGYEKCFYITGSTTSDSTTSRSSATGMPIGNGWRTTLGLNTNGS